MEVRDWLREGENDKLIAKQRYITGYFVLYSDINKRLLEEK